MRILRSLVLALGKDGNAYLLNRNNLGGITAPVAQLSVGFTIGQSSATYTTTQGTYFVFRSGGASLRGLQDYSNKSAHHSLRLEREPERTRFALGYNDGRNEQCHRVGRRRTR